MKKKIIATALAAVSALLLASCGNGPVISDEDGRTIAGRQAGNEAVDYSFAYPKEWELGRNDGVIAIRLDCNESDAVAEYASINVLEFTLADANTGARDYWNGYKKDLAETLKDFTVLGAPTETAGSADESAAAEASAPAAEGEEIKLGGTVALKVRYSGRVTEKTYLYDQIICCRNGTVYMITFTATNDDYPKAKPALDVVAETFVFNG